MLIYIGFVLGIIWLIFFCIIIICFVINFFYRLSHKTESIIFRKIFKFVLKALILFFIILFFMGGCSTIFVNPKVYYCIAYELINNKPDTCGYTNYGIFIFGNEGSGIEIYFKESKER